MKNIFIDCGTNFGQGLSQVAGAENVHPDSWDVYSFEANPITFLNYLNGKPPKNVAVHFTDFQYVRYFNVGVGNAYGFKKYHCEQWNDDGFVGGGSTLIPLDKWHTERVYGFRPNYIETLVPVIDIGDFIKSLNPEPRSIVLKLDIEGSEFDVFRSLKHHNSFPLIRKIYVELHHPILDIQEEPGEWMQILSDNGIEVVRWN